ncbi:DUF423 domain-containing protein [Aureibaculum algae]|uniref:DUF423 domain-containing protein n=1 Tax=Aureibaculum algae TaxID=2584122 RepID=A0A5B7TUQ9_9FLAO|nr:DUF423 domain-containing protein [Aureibaculum algae]QCX38983.1 DUF423 domain-containing protein [Aureibaculum algae]
MKKWNFQVKSDIQEVVKKLDASLGSVDRFAFAMDTSKSDSATFTLQKQGLYAFYLMSINKIIVIGKILKATENETHIEISFKQYLLMKLVIFSSMLTGFAFLIAIILKISSSDSSTFMYILGALLLAIGIVVTWLNLQKKYKKDIQEYKTLITKIVAS